MKDRKLSLFGDTREKEEEFGENYCTTYYGSFAQLAQAQRHRTLDYQMIFNEEDPTFYIPKIIMSSEDSDELEDMWLDDIHYVAGNFPQGLMVKITERGTYQNFMLKCMERLCGCAQLEIMNQTRMTFDKYIFNQSKGLEADYLNKGYSNKPRCTFPKWKCKKPCIWGPKEAFGRLI